MNDVLRILLLVELIIITIFIIIKYNSVNKTPDCSDQILLQRRWIEHILFLREYTIKKTYKIPDNELHEHLLTNIDGIATAIDRIHSGSYYDIRLNLRDHLRHTEKYIDQTLSTKDTKEIIVELDNNAKKMTNILKKLDRQFDPDKLDEFLINHNIFTIKQIDVIIKREKSTVNEYEQIYNNIHGLTNYLSDPPKRWSIKWFGLL